MVGLSFYAQKLRTPNLPGICEIRRPMKPNEIHKLCLIRIRVAMLAYEIDSLVSFHRYLSKSTHGISVGIGHEVSGCIWRLCWALHRGSCYHRWCLAERVLWPPTCLPAVVCLIELRVRRAIFKMRMPRLRQLLPKCGKTMQSIRFSGPRYFIDNRFFMMPSMFNGGVSLISGYQNHPNHIKSCR